MSFIKRFINISPRIPTIYVRVLNNELECKIAGSGQILRRKAEIPFSNNRLLIAEFSSAEQLLRDMIDDLLNQKGKIFKKSLNVVIQPVFPQETALSSVEKRIFADLAEVVGGKQVWVTNHAKELSDQEIVEIMQSKSI